MTKRDCEALARLIGEARGTYTPEQGYALSFFARELTAELKIDNPRFDATKFWQAIRAYETQRRHWRAVQQGQIPA